MVATFKKIEVGQIFRERRFEEPLHLDSVVSAAEFFADTLIETLPLPPTVIWGPNILLSDVLVYVREGDSFSVYCGPREYNPLLKSETAFCGSVGNPVDGSHAMLSLGAEELQRLRADSRVVQIPASDYGCTHLWDATGARQYDNGIFSLKHDPPGYMSTKISPQQQALTQALLGTNYRNVEEKVHFLGYSRGIRVTISGKSILQDMSFEEGKNLVSCVGVNLCQSMGEIRVGTVYHSATFPSKGGQVLVPVRD